MGRQILYILGSQIFFSKILMIDFLLSFLILITLGFFKSIFSVWSRDSIFLSSITVEVPKELVAESNAQILIGYLHLLYKIFQLVYLTHKLCKVSLLYFLDKNLLQTDSNIY